jgi:voltage-gated potassium channel Kch
MVVASLFLVVSRLVTVFLPLHFMRQGHRVSLVPAINLAQTSELSLVMLALGKASGDVSPEIMSLAAFTFAFMAVVSTYAISSSDPILRVASPWLDRLGFPDLPRSAGQSAQLHHPNRIFLLGFSVTASSLLAEIQRRQPELAGDLAVVDFNPQVNEQLRRQGIHVTYGDISQVEVLAHAGLANAEMILCSLPNSLLKGATNLRVLKLVRSINPTAKIVMHAERLSDVAPLYAAGADYVLTPRLLEAAHLLDVINAVDQRALDARRDEQLQALTGRREVVA